MDKTKKRKIRKIQNIRIWPRVIGAIFVYLVFLLVLVLIFAGYASTVASSKLDDMLSSCEHVAEYMDSPQYELNQSRFGGLTKILPKVTAAGYLNDDKEVTVSFGEGSVDADEYVHLMNAISDSGEVELFVEESVTGYLNIDSDGDVKLNLPMLFLDGASISITKGEGDHDVDMDVRIEDSTVKFVYGGWLNRELLGFNAVYVSKNTERTGYSSILYRFSLNLADFTSMIFIGAVFLLLFLLLLLYQINAVARLIKDRRTAFNALYTDIVTGGGNELAFYKDAEKILKKNKNRSYAVVHIRLEKHKGLLACYGVKWIEELDEKIYETIKKRTGRKETHARMDNGDFGILMMMDSEQGLYNRVRDLMNSLSAEITDQKLFFSAGICLVGDHRDDIKNLYNNASLARTYVKDENAEEIKWYTAEIENEQKWERKVEGEMENAMNTGQFEMYLQPKYTTGGEVLGGAEALVRWKHPVDGLIPPGKFIPIFEKNGFILKLDDFMIREVARCQAKWISEGRKVVPISVNVSRAHFMKKDIAEHIMNIVDEYNVPHEYIELELTESAFFDDKKTLIEVVQKMRSYGFPVSMDDFGSGYSSLNSLKEIPLDVLKIDAEFFRGESVDDRGRIIVSEIIELAKTLGMHIVAEGIETRDQVDFLKDQECDLIQGYYFARPMPIPDYEKKAYSNE